MPLKHNSLAVFLSSEKNVLDLVQTTEKDISAKRVLHRQQKEGSEIGEVDWVEFNR